MVEILSAFLWVAITGGLTWGVFLAPSLFGINISLPAKVVLLIPVIAVSGYISASIIKCLGLVVEL